MAAAHLFLLCQSHAFIDGNERVGANAALAFLLMNNWERLSPGKNSWTWFCPLLRADWVNRS
jgi:prophage maintenance system killer protein